MSATRNNNSKKDKMVPVEDLVNHPALVDLDWDSKTLIFFLRIGLIQGKQDGTTKAWFTFPGDVKRAILTRNANFMNQVLDVEDYNWEEV